MYPHRNQTISQLKKLSVDKLKELCSELDVEYTNKLDAAKQLWSKYDNLNNSEEDVEGEPKEAASQRSGQSPDDTTAGIRLLIQQELTHFQEEQQGELQLLHQSLECDTKAVSQWPDAHLQ
jgi:uncharacterized protein YaaW (UPF0174 family)